MPFQPRFILSAMVGKTEQSVCITLCLKLSKSTTKMPEMICDAFGENSLSQPFYEWHSHFKAH
jgi:hypothetical protein